MINAAKLEEAKARWIGAEFNYAKNPSHITLVRVEKARAEYEALKQKSA